jgi:hypothetical protein
MRRVLLTIVLCAAVVGTGATSASAQRRSVVQHLSFQSEPFTLDLTDPSGSAQCDVQAVGYDTGLANIITVFDSDGLPLRFVYVQRVSTILTNPENGKSLELRSADVATSSYAFNTDGSLTIVVEANGLNVLNEGETRFVSAGHRRMTLVFRFDEAGNVILEPVADDFLTPQLGHADPFFCAMLT